VLRGDGIWDGVGEVCVDDSVRRVRYSMPAGGSVSAPQPVVPKCALVEVRVGEAGSRCTVLAVAFDTGFAVATGLRKEMSGCVLIHN